MIRLLLWFLRVVIVGRKRLPAKRCLRGCSEEFGPFTFREVAAPYCELGLCVGCCANNCNCPAERVRAVRELRG